VGPVETGGGVEYITSDVTESTKQKTEFILGSCNGMASGAVTKLRWVIVFSQEGPNCWLSMVPVMCVPFVTII
jgi:hypothetical protein